jgi:hypothetical protein
VAELTPTTTVGESSGELTALLRAHLPEAFVDGALDVARL